MLVFDADSDQNLNRAEFARFINAFCEGCEADFNTLSEFLILLAAMEDNPSEELAFLVFPLPFLHSHCMIVGLLGTKRGGWWPLLYN